MAKKYKELFSENHGNIAISRKAQSGIKDVLTQLKMLQKNEKNRKHQKEFEMLTKIVNSALALQKSIDDIKKVI